MSGEVRRGLCPVAGDNTINFLDRLEHSYLDSVAQPVEQQAFNLWVLGSSPSGVMEV